MTSDSRIAAPQVRPPLWRNATFLKWAAQLGVFFGLVALFWILISQAARNLAAQGRTFTWDFLTDAPGIQLFEGIFTRPSSGLEAFATGIVNMLRITASGIVAATVIGVLVGISRLSSNWLLSRLATFYVESLRNVPVLVQIVFWFFLCTLFFPPLAAEEVGAQWLIFSRSGISIAWLFPTDVFWQWAVFLGLGAWAAVYVYRRRLRAQEETGRDTYPAWTAVGTFGLLAMAGWFLHPIAGAIGWIWRAAQWTVTTVPIFGWQLVFAAVSIYLGVRWIVRFLESRRSPAGLARLTDDDYFRLALAGLIGLVGAYLFLFVPGITSLAVNVTDFVFGFFDQKFDFLRGGSPLRFARPEVVKPGAFPRIGTSGMTLTPNFFGLWVGLTLYTGSFIAEIVRGGILAVPRGQTEAGLALGLRRGQLLRMIILPQAFRIILPPLGNQYLNLAKNTSLGIAIAYAEVVSVGQTLLNQTGQAIQTFLVWMGFYLTVSLVLSLIVNRYNRKLALVER